VEDGEKKGKSKVVERVDPFDECFTYHRESGSIRCDMNLRVVGTSSKLFICSVSKTELPKISLTTSESNHLLTFNWVNKTE
jgi:hypothetical protein